MDEPSFSTHRLRKLPRERPRLRVRALEVQVQVAGERDVAASAKADIFPAYDDDGGLLLVLTPDK